MWKKHEKMMEGVALTEDGMLSISSALLADLGRPEAVDIYEDCDEQKIGLTPGTSYSVHAAKGKSTMGTVSAGGTLSAMAVPVEGRVARPRFEVTSYEGQPMLVVWPLIHQNEGRHAEGSPATPASRVR